MRNYKPGGFLILLFVFLVSVPQIKGQDSLYIKGKVVSHVNKPIAGASVSIESSSQRPAITNDNGEFVITSATGNLWLLISPLSGYKDKRVYLNNQETLKIFLTPKNISSGEDQVTILAQTIKKRNLISAYSDLAIQRVHHSPAISIDQLMQGQVAGMQVTNRSGQPASGAYGYIRGINSINAQNQPMYVVDGIPIMSHGISKSNLEGFEYNPLTAINLLDISNIIIIKDPALTAAYGSRASNGVVFIETLDPSVTKTSVELDLRQGYSLRPERFIPQLQGTQHRTLMSEVLFSSGETEENIVEFIPELFLEKDEEGYIDYQHATNWQDLIFHDSHFSNLNLKIKGGDGIARYGLSFGYINGNGVIKRTGYSAYNLRFVSRLNIFTWLKMDAGVALTYNNSTLKEAATVAQTNPIITSLAKSPLLNPYQYDDDGNELSILAEVNDIGVSNPLATIENFEAKNTNYDVIANMGFKGSFNEYLTLNSKISLHYDVLREQIFYPNKGMELYANLEAWNIAKVSDNTIRSLYNNTYLNFRKTIGTAHDISISAGLNIENNTYEFDWGLGKNAHRNDEYKTIDAGQENLREIGGANRKWNWISLYENINYVFKDKYIVTSSVSFDGSSRVGDEAPNTLSMLGAPFGLFYSAGMAWRISNEPFLGDISWLEELKLRYSYATSGNDDIGESNASTYYESIKYRETVGLVPAAIPNPELTYEKVIQNNIGVDLSLLGNRFQVHFDVFNNETHNMVIFSPVEEYTGYDFRVENSGNMKNTGWELTNYFRMVDARVFQWDVKTFITHIENEVVAIKGDKLVTEITGGEVVNMVGAPVNSFYGYNYLGVYSTQAEADDAGLVNDKRIAYQAGDAMLEDISGPDGTPDGIINNYDKTIIGSSIPEYFGGLVNTFSVGNFSISASLYFTKGNEIFNYVRYKNEQMTGLENQGASVLNRWQNEGHVTDIPRALYNDPIGNAGFSSRWIEDGSFARLKNVTLRYYFPDKFLAFQNAEIYVSANNLYTFTSYLGYDPEFAFSHSHIHQGVDYGQIPQSRQFITGIKVNF